MNVWWCTTHAAQGPNATVETDDGREVEVPGIANGECWRSIWGEADLSLGLCRIVEMQLVATDAAKRMHPVLRLWNPALNDYAIIKCADEILDALDARVLQ